MLSAAPRLSMALGSFAESRLMLQLARIFEDAVRCLRDAEASVRDRALPATVLQMQIDVIRSYEHALDHYLGVPLNAPFLQNSSLGSPYEKWAKFVNDNFDGVHFTVANLLRYTARLVESTLCQALHQTHRSTGAAKDLSNSYTDPVVWIRLGKLQVRVYANTERALVLSPLPLLGQQPFTAEYDIQTPSRQAEATQEVRRLGQAELAELGSLHQAYAKGCRTYYAAHELLETLHDAGEPFGRLHPSWLR